RSCAAILPVVPNIPSIPLLPVADGYIDRQSVSQTASHPQGICQTREAGRPARRFGPTANCPFDEPPSATAAPLAPAGELRSDRDFVLNFRGEFYMTRRVLAALVCAAGLSLFVDSPSAQAQEAYGRQWSHTYNSQ